MSPPTHEFLIESARYLRDVYLPRITRALETLPPEDLWWRPHEDTPSFGNLLLHLEGNLRQWILSGLGGGQDRRERASEFSAKEGASGADLLQALQRTLTEAAEIVAGLPPESLHAGHRIQGIETTGMGAIYHVVEHCSWHTGQMVWIAKARAGSGHGLSFYDEEAINRARN